MKAAKAAAILALLSALPAFTQKAVCNGVDRWSIKTLADNDASKVNKTPVEKTVAEMVALTRPADVNKNLARQSGIETTTVKIAATLTLYKEEADQDYHLVLEDNDDHTMIAEIPDPECAKNGSVLEQITKARQEFNSKFKVGADKHATKIPVVVTGVGFFDLEHGGAGQIGHADNNIEIHPVLDIQFTGPVAPEFENPTETTAAAASSEIKTAVYEPGIGMMWWVITITMTIFYIVAIRETVSTLRRSNTWSLSQALQENGGKPSSSRMIAFLGLLILMVLYMGIGYVAIWRLLNNEPLPNVNTFLLTGLSLFAPYAFNQLKQMVVGATSDDTGSNGSARGPSRPRSAPKVLGVAPSSVSANTSTQITVTGIGFDPNASVSVTTNAVPVTPSFSLVTPNQIQFAVTMPASSASYIAVVHILNPDGGEATGSFQVS